MPRSSPWFCYHHHATSHGCFAAALTNYNKTWSKNTPPLPCQKFSPLPVPGLDTLHSIG